MSLNILEKLKILNLVNSYFKTAIKGLKNENS